MGAHPVKKGESLTSPQERANRVLNQSFDFYQFFLQMILVGVDLLLLHGAACLAFMALLGWESIEGSIHYKAYFSVAPMGALVYLILATFYRFFDLHKPFSGIDFVFLQGKVLLLTLFSLISLVFFSRELAEEAFFLPRLIVLIGISLGSLFLMAWRAFFNRFLQGPFLTRNVLGLGKKEDLTRYIEKINQKHHYNYSLKYHSDSPVLDEELQALFNQLDFHEVVDFERSLDLQELWKSLFKHCRNPNLNIKLLPKKEELLLKQPKLDSLSDLPLIDIPMYPIKGWNSVLKRFFDLFGSLVGLILFGIPMIIVAIGVKWDSPGPIFYRQRRVGRFGKEFDVLKFRSMPENVENKSGPVIAQHNDERCTPFGLFIRRWALDELPQLFSIFYGDMSLVGPRPERPYFIQQFPELGGRRLSVKPGLTGLAQVNSRYYLNLTDKLYYDFYYMDHYSLLTDIKVCFLTFRVLWNETGKPLDGESEKSNQV